MRARNSASGASVLTPKRMRETPIGSKRLMRWMAGSVVLHMYRVDW